MSTHYEFFRDPIVYTGAELSPHWIAARTGKFCSSIVAFRGACAVPTEEMVDLEDRFQGSRIAAREMLHFLAEWFEGDLNLAVARQRLLIAGFAEELRKALPPEKAALVERRGNDLFVAGGKLSVSIVTASPVSTLFHFGVNIDDGGAPVKTASLNALGVEPAAFAERMLALWREELAGMEKARCKVAPRLG